MNRKAFIKEQLYWIIIEFILIGMFVTGSLFFIANMNNSSLFERLYLSRTLAVKASTAMSAPGKLMTDYSHKELENFDVFIEPKEIRVLSRDEKQLSSSFPFSTDQNIDIKTKFLEKPLRIVFEKQNNYLTFQPKEELLNIKLLQDRCSDIQSTAQGLILDPAHGEWDTGETKGDFIEAKVNREIAYQIYRNSPYPKPTSTRDVRKEIRTHLEQRLKTINKKTGYALVGIQTSPYEGTIKAYINANKNTEQSRKLACHINNALVENLELPTLPYYHIPLIIPINPKHLDEKDPLQVLAPLDIGVVVEINNPDINPQIVGELIKKGIAEYKGS